MCFSGRYTHLSWWCDYSSCGDENGDHDVRNDAILGGFLRVDGQWQIWEGLTLDSGQTPKGRRRLTRSKRSDSYPLKSNSNTQLFFGWMGVDG